MATILAQIKQLQERIKVPWRVVYVDHYVAPEDYEEKVIYIHIWI